MPRLVPWCGAAIIANAAFLWLTGPAMMPRGSFLSPDGKNAVRIVEKVYVADPLPAAFFIVRIGPKNEFLDWFYGRTVASIEDGDTTAPPTAEWRDKDCVIVTLPVGKDGLAALAGSGRDERSTIDRYGAIRISYRARPRPIRE